MKKWQCQFVLLTPVTSTSAGKGSGEKGKRQRGQGEGQEDSEWSFVHTRQLCPGNTMLSVQQGFER